MKIIIALLFLVSFSSYALEVSVRLDSSNIRSVTGINPKTCKHIKYTIDYYYATHRTLIKTTDGETYKYKITEREWECADSIGKTVGKGRWLINELNSIVHGDVELVGSHCVKTVGYMTVNLDNNIASGFTTKKVPTPCY